MAAEILLCSEAKIKDCSKQPDAAVTQRKLGHAQKKSLLKFQKGLVYFIF
jgi:hypothetical protein